MTDQKNQSRVEVTLESQTKKLSEYDSGFWATQLLFMGIKLGIFNTLFQNTDCGQST
jgi:hypothetical protein